MNVAAIQYPRTSLVKDNTQPSLLPLIPALPSAAAPLHHCRTPPSHHHLSLESDMSLSSSHQETTHHNDSNYNYTVDDMTPHGANYSIMETTTTTTTTASAGGNHQDFTNSTTMQQNNHKHLIGAPYLTERHHYIVSKCCSFASILPLTNSGTSNSSTTGTASEWLPQLLRGAASASSSTTGSNTARRSRTIGTPRANDAASSQLSHDDNNHESHAGVQQNYTLSNSDIEDINQYIMLRRDTEPLAQVVEQLQREMKKSKVQESLQQQNGELERRDSESQSDEEDMHHQHDEDISSQLSLVPEVFFSENFSLSDPHIFNQFISSHYSRPSSTLIQQEKLQYYETLVDSCLVTQLGQKTEEIFTALTEFDQLELLLRQAEGNTQMLKNDIAHVQHHLVDTPRHLLKLRAQIDEESQVLDSLQQMKHVLESMELLDSLEQTQQYVECIRLIRELERILFHDVSVEKNDSVSNRGELSQIAVLGDVRTELKRKMNALRKHLMEHTLHLIQFDNTSKMESFHAQKQNRSAEQQSVDKSAATTTTTSSSSPAGLSARKLHPLFSALVEIKSLRLVLESHKDQIKTRLFSTLLSECLKEVDSEFAHNSSSQSSGFQFESKQLGNFLRALNKKQFLRCIDLLFDGYLNILIHERQLANVLIRFAQENGHDSNGQVGLSPQMCDKIIQDAHSNLKNTLQLCHSRCALVFSIQSSNTERLSRAELIQLMTRMNRFVTRSFLIVQQDTSTEKSTSRKQFSPLTSTIFTHGRVYLDKFHVTKVAALDSSIRNDSWEWNQNTNEVQYIINKQFPSIAESNHTEQQSEPLYNNSHYLRIHQRHFLVSSSTLVLLSLLNKYFDLFNAKYVAFFQPLDIAEKALRLLNEFNKELREQILGAKALENNLKTIKVGHLVLSSECLNFLIEFVPFVKDFMEKQLPEKHQYFLSHFDNLSSDLKEHRRAIFVKVEDILRYMGRDPIQRWTHLEWWREVDSGHSESTSSSEQQHSSLSLPTKELRQISIYLKRVYSKLKQFLVPRNEEDFISVFTRICEYFLSQIEKSIDLILKKQESEEHPLCTIRNLKADLTQFENYLERFQMLISGFESEEGTGIHHRLTEYLEQKSNEDSKWKEADTSE